MDKSIFIGEKEYRAFAGPDWPTYKSFVAGISATDPVIQTEIDQFTAMMQQSYLELHPDLNELSTANQSRQGQHFYDKQYTPNRCRVTWDTLGINSNGHAFICSSPSWVPKFVGNLLDNDVWAVLNSETAQRIRQEIYHGRYYYCNSQLCAFFQKVKQNKYSATGSSEPLPYEARPEYQVHQIPENLIFDFDYTCNFSCPSCRTQTINNNKHHVIRPINNEIVHRIKTQIIDNIDTQPVNIRWAGGEPFISEPYLELFDYISSAHKPNIVHTIQTNGSYLKSKHELLTKLLPSVKELRISFDAATESTYRKIRVGGVWENLIDNVQWVQDYIKRNQLKTLISADFVVQQTNYQEIPQFEQLCQTLGITNIHYQKMWNWGTWPDSEFHQHNVYHKQHSEYSQLVEIFHNIGKNIVE